MKAICIRSFRAYHSNIKNKKVKSNTVWSVFHGTTIHEFGNGKHLEYNNNYIEISNDELQKYFVIL